ncbi:MAG: lipoate--protein ligase family protein [Verrucomicrobiota bacterium]
MKYLDLSLPSPEENLACDEALLDACEAGQSGPVLRFWETADRFVVVGYSNRVEQEVNSNACAQWGIPVFRRCSGGGTVLQGPGVLNYALVLPIDSHPELAGIPSTNCFVMQRHRQAVANLFPDRRIEVKGHTDLASDDLKFSGNAQRRHKNFLLFHGTFLINCDLTWIEKLLPFPSRQPDYRKDRSHHAFLMNLGGRPEKLKAALRNVWGAHETASDFPRENTRQLALNKYATKEWNLKF